MSSEKIRRAVEILRAGGIIAYPTEAVWGLGCDPRNEAALRRLLSIKHRDPAKGLILIAADFGQLEPWLAEIDPRLQEKALASWPGPVTWIWPAKDTASALLRGNHATLAVRVTGHPLVAQLCREFGGALVSTSANRSGQPPARTADDVRRLLGDAIDCIVEGQTGGREAPSEIRDVITGATLREGSMKTKAKKGTTP